MTTKTIEPPQAPELAESLLAVQAEQTTLNRLEPLEQEAGITDSLWYVRAACRGPHQQIFYPPTRFERRVEKRRREQRAKEICRSCSVVDICRQQAIERREPYGIWGGLNEHERREHAERHLQTT